MMATNKKAPWLSEEVARRKRRAKTQSRFIKTVLFFFTILLLCFIPRLSYFTIDSISVSGNTSVDREIVISATNEALAGYKYLIFPKRSIFFYPSDNIEGLVIKSDPRIRTSDVSISSLRSINVKVEERQADALWCRVENSDDCYFMDDLGVRFAKAPTITGTIYTRFMNSSTTGEVLGTLYLDDGLYKGLRGVINDAKSIQVFIPKVVVSVDNIVTATTENGTKLIFMLGDDYSMVLDKLKAIMNSNDFTYKDSKGAIQLDYLDLRFGEKVYYKPTNVGLVGTSSAGEFGALASTSSVKLQSEKPYTSSVSHNKTSTTTKKR